MFEENYGKMAENQEFYFIEKYDNHSDHEQIQNNKFIEICKDHNSLFDKYASEKEFEQDLGNSNQEKLKGIQLELASKNKSILECIQPKNGLSDFKVDLEEVNFEDDKEEQNKISTNPTKNYLHTENKINGCAENARENTGLIQSTKTVDPSFAVLLKIAEEERIKKNSRFKRFGRKGDRGKIKEKDTIYHIKFLQKLSSLFV